MNNEDSNRRRRELFDAVADLYERARPGYPTELVDELVNSAHLTDTSRVLEVGAGTGNLTVPLAKRGASIVAVELGANLARVARRNLAGFERVEVVVADFDTWIPPSKPFDLLVAATAFHWLDPATRIAKCASVLRPGGILAIVGTRWGVDGGDDPFFRESQSCYARWDPNHDPSFRPPELDELPTRREDLEISELFACVTHRRYAPGREYSAAQYRDLLSTFSNIRALDSRARDGFLACIFDLIQSRFGGVVVRHDVYDLWTAQRAPV